MARALTGLGPREWLSAAVGRFKPPPGRGVRERLIRGPGDRLAMVQAAKTPGRRRKTRSPHPDPRHVV
jgi:hypothetical protein